MLANFNGQSQVHQWKTVTCIMLLTQHSPEKVCSVKDGQDSYSFQVKQGHQFGNSPKVMLVHLLFSSHQKQVSNVVKDVYHNLVSIATDSYFSIHTQPTLANSVDNNVLKRYLAKFV